jgi:hypothetical protein
VVLRHNYLLYTAPQISEKSCVLPGLASNCNSLISASQVARHEPPVPGRKNTHHAGNSNSLYFQLCEHFSEDSQFNKHLLSIYLDVSHERPVSEMAPLTLRLVLPSSLSSLVLPLPCLPPWAYKL